MAQGKKSFIAYSDWYGTFKSLPDDVAGKLIKHIFSYVNDENPSTDDYIINALFEQIKSTLKRDLIKWETQTEQRSNAGKRSAELRALNKVNESSTVVESRQRKSTDSVNVNVSVNDNVNVKVNNIEERKLKFADTLKPYVETYGKEMIRKFFDYWTEPNKSNTKMLWELKKTWSTSLRLKTWAEKPFNNTTPQSQYPPLISKNEQRFNKFQEASDGAAAIIRAKYGIEEDS